MNTKASIRRRPLARGLTLVECVMASLIIAVAMVAAVKTVGAARKGEWRRTDSRIAYTLAQDLLNEIANQPYTDAFDTATVFGPTAAEAATGNRSLFNDVNDYRNWTETQPKAKDGTSLGYNSSWIRSVQVGFVSTTDPNVTSATNQGLAKVTVTVTRNNVTLASVATLRSAGLPATEACKVGANWYNLAPAHNLALGGTSSGPGTNIWTFPDGQNGLVAHWKFNETSGTTAADSIGTNTATLTNGPTFTTSGKYGNAINLDGTNDFAVVNHSSELSIDTTLTLAAWVYPTGIPNADRWYGIFHKGQTSSNRNYFLRLTDATISFGYLDTGNTTRRFTGGSVATANQWYHVAATFDDAADKVIIYLNGVAVATFTTTTKPKTNTSPLNLANGYSGITTDYFKGRIDDARIYNRVLSAAEITTLYNGGEP